MVWRITPWISAILDGVEALKGLTVDQRNVVVLGRMAKRGWAEVTPIQRTQQLAEVKRRAERLPENTRRTIFGLSVKCEDRHVDDDDRQQQCKADVQKQYGVSDEELKLIEAEGVSLTWPPLPQARTSVGPIIDAGLKLCQKKTIAMPR